MVPDRFPGRVPGVPGGPEGGHGGAWGIQSVTLVKLSVILRGPKGFFRSLRGILAPQSNSEAVLGGRLFQMDGYSEFFCYPSQQGRLLLQSPEPTELYSPSLAHLI